MRLGMAGRVDLGDLVDLGLLIFGLRERGF